MKNKKNIIIIAIIMLVLGIMVFNPAKYSSVFMKEKLEPKELNRSTFAIYKELTQGGSNWTLSEDTKFPDKGYILNTTRTECHGYNDEPVEGALTQNDDMSITIISNKTIYCNIYFDKDDTAPVVSKFEIIGKDSQQQELRNGYTYEYGVTYEIGWLDTDVKEYCISSINTGCNGEWIKTNNLTNITTDSINLSDGEGLKTMYLFIKDKANNISAVTDISTKQITVDQTPPEVKTLTLTGTPDNTNTLTNNTLYTHTTNINYVMNWDNEDVANYCISNTESCSDYKGTTGKSQSGTVIVANGEGEKTVYAYLKDKANNISIVKTNTITLDLTVPTVTINKQSVTTESITVTIDGTDSNEIAQRQCRIATINSGIWENAKLVSGTYQCTISGLGDGVTYTVEGRTIDKSGRVSTTKTVSDTTEKKPTPAIDLTKEENRPSGLSENLLGDMYRFVGTKDDVENYICFGYSDAATDCNQGETSDYMYRIIGITPGGQLKLIKNTAIRESGSSNEGQYYWSEYYAKDIGWPQSNIFLRLNGKGSGLTTGYTGNTNLFIDSTKSNVTYIQSKGDTTWYNKIEQKHSWWYGGIYSKNTDGSANEIYQIETGQLETQQNYGDSNAKWPASQKVTAAIGLMYLSDYYYSYATNGFNSSSTNCKIYYTCKNSWLHITNNGKSSDYSGEWTMTRYGGGSGGMYFVWLLMSDGIITEAALHTPLSIRPVFFLTPEASQIADGTGTSSDPFIIVK